MKKRGFTLVEIAIGIVIFSIVSIGVLAILASGNNTWNQEAVLLEMQQQTRLAMDGITKELRQIDPLQSVIISDSDQKIVFYVTDIGNPISYYLNGSNQIVREHPAGTSRILANNINSLTFSHIGDVINISLLAQKIDKRGRSLSFSLTEKIRLRNG
ncbi:MAG: type II secretion system protein [Candidatus Omnitrophica bacterium]|jgi:prepilin-type N-terminal cleavage/methylation domain-containing protein|nr:type II secretion system protein [Candidatus Omnitrophota bacterium]